MFGKPYFSKRVPLNNIVSYFSCDICPCKLQNDGIEKKAKFECIDQRFQGPIKTSIIMRKDLSLTELL